MIEIVLVEEELMTELGRNAPKVCVDHSSTLYAVFEKATLPRHRDRPVICTVALEGARNSMAPKA